MQNTRLLCIEGPAGSGKTTLCQALAVHARANAITCHVVDEFSDSPMGIVLQAQLQRFANTCLERDSLQALLSCIADKTTSLLQARATNSELMLLDRGFLTQTALVVPHLANEADQALARELIHASNNWLAANFSITTVLLQLSPQENLRRLSQRLQRELTTQEQDIMQQEIAVYAALAHHPDAALLGLVVIDAQHNTEQLISMMQTQLAS